MDTQPPARTEPGDKLPAQAAGIPFKVAGICAAVVAAWVVLSDLPLAHGSASARAAFLPGVGKALLFALATAGLVGWVVRRCLRQVQRAEGEIATRLEHYHMLFAEAHDSIFVCDAQGRLIEVNPRGTEMFGYSREEFLRLHVTDCLVPEERARAREGIRTIREGKKRVIEHRFLRRDGSIFPGESSTKLLPDGRLIGIVRDITKRKRAERKLRESEASMAAAQQLTHFGSWEMDLTVAHDVNRNALRWSDETYRIFGYAPGSVLVTNELFFRAVPPEEHEAIRRAVADAIRERHPYSIEHRVIRPNGEVRHVHELAQVVADEATGQPVKMVGTVRDITDQRRADETLRLSEQRFEFAARATNDALWDWDLRTDLLWWSEGFETLFGYPRSEVEPGITSWTSRLHPEDFARVKRGIDRAIDGGGRSWSDEYRFRRKDGSYAYIYDRGFVIRDAGGKPVRMVGGMTDLTARKQAEEALARSEEDYRTLFEHATDAIFICDAAGRLLGVNQHAATLTGYPREELRQKNIQDVIAPSDHAGLRQRLASLKEAGAGFSEHRFVRQDGSIFPGETSIKFLPDGRLLALVRDVTARHEAEQTRQRLEAQLRQAQKLQAIGTLAGGIAHDFNNILSAILGNAELLRLMLPPDGKSAAHVAGIVRASQRARDLVQQILTFSRQQEQVRQSMTLQPLIKESLRLLRAIWPPNITIQTDLLAQEPPIVADPTQMHQVLMNLCTNAAYAMRGAGGRLTIAESVMEADAYFARAHPQMQPGRYLRLTVSDTGQGMDAATLERIFEPFFTTKAPGEGTGLGLAVVHGIVEAHAGVITAYSEPGRGATFHVYLPLADAGAAPMAAPEEKPVAQQGRNEWIILVDDEEPILSLGSIMLEHLGYQVKTFDDPLAVLAHLRAHPNECDLIVSDLTMPKMNGVELARAARQIQPDLPIVLMTGYGGALDTRGALALGIREVVAKPFTLETLAAAVQGALE